MRGRNAPFVRHAEWQRGWKTPPALRATSRKAEEFSCGQTNGGKQYVWFQTNIRLLLSACLKTAPILVLLISPQYA